VGSRVSKARPEAPGLSVYRGNDRKKSKGKGNDGRGLVGSPVSKARPGAPANELSFLVEGAGDVELEGAAGGEQHRCGEDGAEDEDGGGVAEWVEVADAVEDAAEDLR
jgi:hypothetical protein